ncbi:F-box protein At5g07610-like [Bidens hawaiensis]|uniref:F-box protein At5g07610-like n=1 Tax=Bidens hawaiensis TaxID=980011 RepID=UPI00404B26AC
MATKSKKTFSQPSMEDSNHQSGAFIGSNDDLLTKILIRLPVTSIDRFKSVCKHGRSLLTNSHLTRRYDNLLKTPGIFAGNTYVPFEVENSLDFYFNLSGVKIVQSCNGLLLCSTIHNDAREFFVLNPTTKQLEIIPLVPGGHNVMALAFHHTDCIHYKVVCIRALETDEDLIQIQVYSSDTRKWKICIESFSSQKPKFHNPVYWNGAVNWIPAPFNRSSNFLYFKLDGEQLQMLPLPKGKGTVSDKILTMYVGESRGHLHLILLVDREEDILLVNVYEMLRNHSGWFVKYRLQLDELLSVFPSLKFRYLSRDDFGNYLYPYRCVFHVVDVIRGEKEEETFLVLFTPWKLIRYNVHDKSLKELYIDKNESCEYELPSVHRYIKTLSSF